MRTAARQSSRAYVLVLLLLAAFIFQTAVLRAHIHTGASDTSLELAAGTSGGGKPAPVHNEADCPLWHASTACGAGLITIATTPYEPLIAAAKAPLDERAIFPERFASAWRSRAPPIL
ncbi:MAG: hypothetical protein ACKVRO_10110 [Micropepsaceae bacterium]